MTLSGLISFFDFSDDYDPCDSHDHDHYHHLSYTL